MSRDHASGDTWLIACILSRDRSVAGIFAGRSRASQMDKRNQALDEEMREEEDLNVSNLLVTKSERAPKTASTRAQNKKGSEVMRVVAVSVLGSLAFGMIVWLGRQLILRPRYRSIGLERM